MISSPSEPRSPSLASRIRVYLVDDHPIVRLGLRTLLETQPSFEICGETAEPEAALREIESLRPDVVVLDVGLQGRDGLSLTKALRALPQPPRVLIVSGQEEYVFAERALLVGANGYLMKQDASDQFTAALRTVAQGETYLSEKLRRRRANEYRPKSDRASSRSGLLSLSPRELAVFKLLGTGFSTREIADQLKLSVKTVDSYRESLKLKLHLPNGAELVRHAIHSGRLGWL